MKNYITLLFLLIAANVFAQETIEVKVKNHHSSFGNHPAYDVVVPQATAKDAIDLFKKTISPDGLFKKSVKAEKIKDEWHIDAVVIDKISTKPLNVIAQISEYPNNLNLRFFFQTEDGFLGSDSLPAKASEAATQFIYDYSVDLYRQAVEEELKYEEKVLKSLENDLDKLEKDNKKYISKMNDAKQESKELTGITNSHQESLSQNINLGLSNEETNKQLKDSKKDLKKSKKEEAKFEKKADKNVKEQKDKAEEIEAQQQKVEEVNTKLNNIK
jgi:hypothetical protein